MINRHTGLKNNNNNNKKPIIQIITEENISLYLTSHDTHTYTPTHPHTYTPTPTYIHIHTHTLHTTYIHAPQLSSTRHTLTSMDPHTTLKRNQTATLAKSHITIKTVQTADHALEETTAVGT